MRMCKAEEKVIETYNKEVLLTRLGSRTNNVVIYEKGIISLPDSNFILEIKLGKVTDYSDFQFILDSDYTNKFNFSVYKDYMEGEQAPFITLYIEGDESQSFAITGIAKLEVAL